jgi:ferredoxin
MARQSRRLAENQPGPFFVDESCIDCDTCRQIAPATFARSDARGLSFVARQPDAADEARRARLALVACPTASIGSTDKTGLGAAAHAFPLPIDGDVHYCGYASQDSFGAASYFIRRAAATCSLIHRVPRDRCWIESRRWVVSR